MQPVTGTAQLTSSRLPPCSSASRPPLIRCVKPEPGLAACDPQVVRRGHAPELDWAAYNALCGRDDVGGLGLSHVGRGLRDDGQRAGTPQPEQLARRVAVGVRRRFVLVGRSPSLVE
jgi:hypothetical protein